MNFVPELYSGISEACQEAGLHPDEVGITHLIRCAPKRSAHGSLPTGKERTAISICRQFDEYEADLEVPPGVEPQIIDGGLSAWKPTHMILTYSPQDYRKVEALAHLVSSDIQKAVRLSDSLRPVVVFGREAAEFMFPFGFRAGNGGLKAWRGTLIPFPRLDSNLVGLPKKVFAGWTKY